MISKGHDEVLAGMYGLILTKDAELVKILDYEFMSHTINTELNT